MPLWITEPWSPVFPPGGIWEYRSSAHCPHRSFGSSLSDHYRLGTMIRDTAEKLGRRVCVVASGDLSHHLKPDGPYGYRAEGPQYDERIMDVMGRAAFGELFSFQDAFCEAAGECGHRSFTILAGCLDGRAVQARALSYEGSFGVGYGVCLFSPGAADESRQFLAAELEAESARLQVRREKRTPTSVWPDCPWRPMYPTVRRQCFPRTCRAR